MTISNHPEIQSLKDFKDLAFGQRIAHVINTRGISKAWVAEQLGISKQALNYLLKHSVKPKFVDEFAELLALDPDWIENGVGAPSIKSQTIAVSTHLPVFTQSTLLQHVTHSGIAKETIDFSHQHIEDFTAYKLEDDSNFPPFIEGSILIFNTERKPKNEDYVLFTLENNVFVRQYLIDAHNICYKASNSQHKTFINPTTTILGVLIEVRYQL
jgi:hypothetical protein